MPSDAKTPSAEKKPAICPLENHSAGALRRKDNATARDRNFDPNHVHNRSGHRSSHLNPYFHGYGVSPFLVPNQVVELDPAWMVAHFIDVGQGDAILLEFECGAALIDTGGEATEEVNGAHKLGVYLDKFFTRRADLSRTLELVVLSHPHQDHTLGVQALAGKVKDIAPISIRNLVDNGETAKGLGVQEQKTLRNFAAALKARYQAVNNRDIEFLDGLTSTIIDPFCCAGVDPVIRAVWGRDSDDWSANANNHSVVLRVDFGEASFLFLGDSQVEALGAMLASYSEDLSILDVDVLKVGHHGSRNAILPAFLAAVSPELAVIQAGDPSLSKALFSAFSFGHPNLYAVANLTAQEYGVSRNRPATIVEVGLKGRTPSSGAPPEFTTLILDRAVYATSWDGTVIVEARRDGVLRVITSGRESAIQ